MKTRITELLGIKYPIFQGGMAWVADGNRSASRNRQDGGSSLSQRQAQLLAIARVFLKAPRILVLVLDEATSSIDTRTERLVQEAFDRLMEGRTSFIIAHRLSTIEKADMILVMVAGQIIEWGIHTSLMAQKGFYYRMQMGEL